MKPKGDGDRKRSGIALVFLRKTPLKFTASGRAIWCYLAFRNEGCVSRKITHSDRKQANSQLFHFGIASFKEKNMNLNTRSVV